MRRSDDPSADHRAARPVTDILVLCTVNTCRSPMAEALFARRLARAGVAALVHSAGVLGEGEGPPPEAISAMAAYGLDTRSHRSHQVSVSDLAHADLVLAMARVHVRHAVVLLPGVWSRAFTLKDLVRRGEAMGARLAGEPMAEWLRRAHHGRERSSMLGDGLDDDVADPIGGPSWAYCDTAMLLDALVNRLVELGWGEGATLGPRPRSTP
jgi:protein-tyrosine-phosphatase